LTKWHGTELFHTQSVALPLNKAKLFKEVKTYHGVWAADFRGRPGLLFFALVSGVTLTGTVAGIVFSGVAAAFSSASFRCLPRIGRIMAFLGTGSADSLSLRISVVSPESPESSSDLRRFSVEIDRAEVNVIKPSFRRVIDGDAK
jgi:hypothetical protein